MESSPALIIEFAHIAATHGWKRSTLRSFCTANGISLAGMRAQWPMGIRSVARQLNAQADAVMVARARVLGSPTLSGLILGRFADNEPLKGAVGRLAQSDAMHPFDTLARTARTARAMWQCLSVRNPRTGGPGWLRVWALTIMYSVFVLVWLTDRSISQKAVRTAVHFGVRLLGER
ncbi:hypothetical protein ACN9MB_14540 [Dyella kyungheensis]|uniref:hypothetical protein n=1 Tax=Dyella kyungheensis TaxID=1242174 RepID=UPI003CF4DA69